ncbi:MAG TPA: hypothetical protein VN088_10935, partial [Nocardioides sp.]|nr:hypothetical protein [Nocardioides sp.]
FAGLPEVMSHLRRRYSYGAWRSIDNAPATVEAAVAATASDIEQLNALLARSPLDVPAAADLLAQVRKDLDSGDEAIRAATSLRDRLDAVADDPDALLARLRHRLIDARRFLAARPPADTARYGPTLDALAQRTDKLATAVQAVRPDWGAVLSESEAIDVGLDSMIRTVRAH